MKNKILRLLIPALFAAPILAFSQTSLYFPPKTGTAWATTDPASLGFCPERIDSLYQFLEEKKTKSFILLQDGKIVLEKYFGTFQQDSFWYWASAGKSLTAFLVGQAQEEGLLSISDPSSDYLGAGWTSAPPDKEALITISHQLTMTSGLNDAVPNDDCSDPACLIYLADAGTRWAYHNAPYHLLHDVLAAASGQTINQYTKSRVLDRTGMKGLWIDHVQYGRARDMARFGLLTLAGGIWDGDTLLHDQQYQYAMAHPSQDLNKSYGYLWWLNGQESFMLPGLQFVFPGSFCPNAPADMFAALGKNDQKIHIVPSKRWVVVRQGDAAYVGPGGGNVPIAFDNVMWDYLNKLTCSPSSAGETPGLPGLRVYPNPSPGGWTVEAPEAIERLELYRTDGRLVREYRDLNTSSFFVEAGQFPPGAYLIRVYSGDKVGMLRVFVVG